jgi:hypothetical protein
MKLIEAPPNASIIGIDCAAIFSETGMLNRAAMVLSILIKAGELFLLNS